MEIKLKPTDNDKIHTLDISNEYLHIFPGPPAFCKKAVERVNTEKNILNSSVVWSSVVWSSVVWSSVVWKISIKVICMYIIRSRSLS